jgi:plastocyanin
VDRPRVLVLAAAVVTVVASAAAIGAAATSSDSGGVSTNVSAPSTVPGAGSAAVEIRNFAFEPEALTVPRGTVVTWTNGDSDTHSVQSDDGSFGSPNLDGGATFSFAFNEPGTFDYECGIHPTMQGTVMVEG